MKKKTNWKLSGVILAGLILALILLFSYDTMQQSDKCKLFEIGQEVIVTEGIYAGAKATVLDYGTTSDLIINFEGFNTVSIPCENLE